MLLLGDVAFCHDQSSLTALAARQLPLTIVVVDNDGGGIFSFLPQRTTLTTERFEQLFGTPHGTDLVGVARAHGLGARTVDTVDDLLAAVTDREATVVRVRQRPRRERARPRRAARCGGRGARLSGRTAGRAIGEGQSAQHHPCEATASDEPPPWRLPRAGVHHQREQLHRPRTQPSRVGRLELGATREHHARPSRHAGERASQPAT